MKYLFYGIGVFASFFLGKMLYGTLSPILLGTEKEEVRGEMVREVKVQSAMGTVVETIDLRDVDEKDYPTKITLATSVILSNEEGLDPLPLETGSPVTPVQLVDTTLIVTSPLASHLTGRVSVFETSFVEDVAKKRMDRRLSEVAARDAQKGSEAADPGKKENMEKPAQEMVKNEPKEEMVEPEPEPEPVAEPEVVELTDEQLIAEMKASLQSGAIKELAMDSVQTWEVLPVEQFDGQEFRVGLATYQEMTILGQKTLQAKALFRDGKLVKWIHAKTGMQIR